MEIEIEGVVGPVTVLMSGRGNVIEGLRFGPAAETALAAGRTMQVKRPVQTFVSAIHQYFQDPSVVIPWDALNLSSLSRFQMKVYEELGKIPVGETRSYAELADAVGLKGGARAVGGALGRNPFPIVIPCHRILPAGGGLGGYLGGVHCKRMLLMHEGVELGSS